LDTMEIDEPLPIGKLINLKKLEINTLFGVLEGIKNLKNLKHLSLGQVWIIEDLEKIILDPNQGFYGKIFPTLELLREVGELRTLKRLKLEKIIHLTSLPKELGNLSSLKTLEIKALKNLTSLPKEIGNLPNLKVLRIENNEKLKSLPLNIRRLRKKEGINFFEYKNGTYSPPESETELKPVYLDMTKKVSLEKLSKSDIIEKFM
jgi:Leucine-rich repeat (LRR) protein